MIKFNKPVGGTCSICKRVKEDTRILQVLVGTEFKTLRVDNHRAYKVCSVCLNSNINTAVIQLNEPRIEDLQKKIQKKIKSITLSTRDPKYRKRKNVKNTNQQRS